MVYLAFKNVFKGLNAQLRTAKKTRKLIQKHLDNGDDNVCNTAKALPQNEIFASTLEAKIRFPEVFEVSPAQSAERVASEAEAARSDADALRDAAEGRQGTWASPQVNELELAHKGKGKEPGMLSKTVRSSLC